MPTEENTEIDLSFWAGSGLAEERLRNPFKTTQELEILSKWYCKNKKKEQVCVGGAEMYMPLCRMHYMQMSCEDADSPPTYQ